MEFRYMILFLGHENPIAVDYDSVESRLYWTDVSAKVIKRAFMNGTGEEVISKLPKSMNLS